LTASPSFFFLKRKGRGRRGEEEEGGPSLGFALQTPKREERGKEKRGKTELN